MKDYTSIKKIILIVIIVISIIVSLVYGIIYYKKEQKESFEISESLNTNNIKKVNSKKDNSLQNNLVVDIKGEINKPGIYKVNKKMRVTDVIDMAGGLTNNADTSVINLSKKVTDEMVIIIYSKEEINNFIKTKEEENKKLEICNDGEVINGACIESNSTLNNNTGKININTATLEVLQTLPGIGESKAKNIISYREEHGNFTKIEELLDVTGIGEAIYDQIKDYITI